MIRGCDISRFFQKNGEGQTVFLYKGYDCKGVILIGHIDCEDDEALFFVFLIHLFDGRHFCAAWRAPGCPKVYKYGLTTKFRECVCFTVRGLESEIGRGKACMRCGVA